MRKCKLIISSMTDNTTLTLDEEKNICLLNNKEVDGNVELLLCKIEDIISTWEQQPKRDSFVVDGVDVEVYFVDGENKQAFKYTNMSTPNNFCKIIRIIEELNG